MTKAALITSILAVALLGVAHPSFADEDGASYKLSTAGVDLQSAAGAKTMLVRIRVASEKACGSAPYIRDLNGASSWKACVADTVARAVKQLNAPMVTVALQGPNAGRQTVAVMSGR